MKLTQLLVDSIVQKKESITLNWDPIDNAETYELMYDGKVIYKGNNTKFVHSDLNKGELYQYSLVALDNTGKLLDVVKIKTTTKFNEDNVLNVNTLVSDEQITLNWSSKGTFERYDIYRDDRLIGSTSNDTFVDKKISSDKNYLYKVKAISKKDKKQTNHDSTQEGNEFTLISSINSFSEELNDSIKENKKIKGEKILSLTAPPSLPSNTLLRFQTFIPDKYVSIAGYTSLTNAYFAGDNRGYNATSSSYRTRLDMNIGWSSQTVTPSKSIGYSHLYIKQSDGTYKEDPSSPKQASSSGIVTSVYSKSSSMVTFTVNHNVGIPFTIWGVSPPAITYDLNATVYRDGTTIIQGDHDKAPSYEFYRKDDSYTPLYYGVYFFDNEGFENLFPLAPNETIDVNVNRWQN